MSKSEPIVLPYNDSQLEQLVGTPLRIKRSGAVCLVMGYYKGKIDIPGIYPFGYDSKAVLSIFEHVDGSQCGNVLGPVNYDYY